MDRDKYVVRSYSTTRKSDYELIKLAKLKRKSVSEIVRCAVEEYLQKEYNAMIKTNITIKNDIAILDFELPSGIITPEDIVNLELPDAVKEGFADKIVVISGRVPIWLYCVIAFVYHQCKGVAVYDTRVNGAEIIQTNSKDYKLGQIVGIY